MEQINGDDPVLRRCMITSGIWEIEDDVPRATGRIEPDDKEAYSGNFSLLVCLSYAFGHIITAFTSFFFGYFSKIELSLFAKRKEEKKRNPRGIRPYYTPFPDAYKDNWGISAAIRKSLTDSDSCSILLPVSSFCGV